MTELDPQTVQWVAEGLLGILGVFIAFTLQGLRKGQEQQRMATDALRAADEDVRTDINDWKVHVASSYVRRDEIFIQHRELMSAIERLDAKISHVSEQKADK